MLNRLRNIWHPENFHLHHMLGRGTPCFEGWYFKLVDAAGTQPYAVIPGVFLGDDAHAFIQLLDGRAGASAYHRFPLRAFAADRRRFEVRIGNSRFHRGGLVLDIGADETAARQSVHGTIRCSPWQGWPVKPASPGVMGPYSFAPFMECKHGILSMDHDVSGTLVVNGATTCFDGGRGYIEKDWGRSFPRGYAWAQSNHFGTTGISVSASVARIPWLTGSFRGHLVGFLLGDTLYRFTTYTHSRIDTIAIDDQSYRLAVSDRTYRLELSATRTEGGVLHAPYDRQMLERVAEAMTSAVHVRLQNLATGNTLFEGHGKHGCLEVQGDLHAILSG